MYIKAFDKMIENHPGEIKIASGAPAKPNGGARCSRNGQTGAAITKKKIAGEEILLWWLWMHRKANVNEPNPIWNAPRKH